jgi:DNA-binding response OmpR family regulator
MSAHPGNPSDGDHESEGRLEGVRVLIVDDDQDVREAFDAAFQSEGALTQCVGDGNEAVRVCQSDPPDLVILDMMLPKRSGFLALEKIKGHERSPLVIMVTANEGKRHNAYAETLGVDAYLQKPVPIERLLETAARLLDEHADDFEVEDEEELGEEDGER